MNESEPAVSSAERFIEEMGLMSQARGEPRIAGRIFGLLMIEGQALSLQQISEQLGVSRASVSTNARLLVKRGMLRLTAHTGDRQDYYQLVSLAQNDMLAAVAQQFVQHAQTIAAYIEPIRSEKPEAAARIAELSQFYEKSAAFLQSWALAVRQEASQERTQELPSQEDMQ
mgnify:CR=1 FL=1